jgi:hypothetical protein
MSKEKLVSPDAISQEDERSLRASGCEVQRIAKDFAAQLERLVKEGRAY